MAQQLQYAQIFQSAGITRGGEEMPTGERQQVNIAINCTALRSSARFFNAEVEFFMPGKTSQIRSVKSSGNIQNEFNHDAKDASQTNTAAFRNTGMTGQAQPSSAADKVKKASTLVNAVLQQMENDTIQPKGEAERIRKPAALRHDTYVYQGKIFRLSDSEDNDLYTR